MSEERTGLIQFGGVDKTIIGPDIAVGQTAPDFIAVGNDWEDVQPLSDFAGKVLVIAPVLSLETDVCDREIRRFNEEAAGLGEDVQIFIISSDLPFTQKRWCGAAGVERVSTLSDSTYADFGPKYGCLIKEMRVLRRAVFVVGKDGVITYSDYMPELGDEPDYDAVLEAVRAAL
jgi:thiol peroxidase